MKVNDCTCGHAYMKHCQDDTCGVCGCKEFEEVYPGGVDAMDLWKGRREGELI